MARYLVEFSQGAERDLEEIIDFYVVRKRKFAVELFQSIKSRVADLADIPDRGRIVPELERQGFLAYRELIEGNYRIVYSVSGNRVLVHAVVDSRRNLDEILLKKVQLHFGYPESSGQ